MKPFRCLLTREKLILASAAQTANTEIEHFMLCLRQARNPTCLVPRHLQLCKIVWERDRARVIMTSK